MKTMIFKATFDKIRLFAFARPSYLTLSVFVYRLQWRANSLR